MNEINNQFTVTGVVTSSWEKKVFGKYVIEEIWIETKSQYPQELRIAFYEREGLGIDWKENIIGNVAIVKGYVKSNLYTNKRGEQDCFINLVGCQFSLINAMEEERNRPYIPSKNENIVEKPKVIESPKPGVVTEQKQIQNPLKEKEEAIVDDDLQEVIDDDDLPF